jgi:hypothetical protein
VEFDVTVFCELLSCLLFCLFIYYLYNIYFKLLNCVLVLFGEVLSWKIARIVAKTTSSESDCVMCLFVNSGVRHVLCPMLLVSPDCPILIASSVFSNVFNIAVFTLGFHWGSCCSIFSFLCNVL